MSVKAYSFENFERNTNHCFFLKKNKTILIKIINVTK